MNAKQNTMNKFMFDVYAVVCTLLAWHDTHDDIMEMIKSL